RFSRRFSQILNFRLPYHFRNVVEAVENEPAHGRVADPPLLPPCRCGIIRNSQQLLELGVVQEDEVGVGDLPALVPLQGLDLSLDIGKSLFTEESVWGHS